MKTRRRNEKIEYYVNWKGYPDNFNSWIYSCSLMSANVGSSAGQIPERRDTLFLPRPCSLHHRDYQYSQLVYKRYKYLPVIVTGKRKCRLSTSESIDQHETRNDVISYDSTIQQQHEDVPSWYLKSLRHSFIESHKVGRRLGSCIIGNTIPTHSVKYSRKWKYDEHYIAGQRDRYVSSRML